MIKKTNRCWRPWIIGGTFVATYLSLACQVHGSVTLAEDTNEDPQIVAILGVDRIASLGSGANIVLAQEMTPPIQGAGIHHAIDGNLFFRGEDTPNRAPCPAINLLANHGFTASVGEAGTLFGDDNYALVDLDLDTVYESVVRYSFPENGNHAILGVAIESSGESIDYAAGVAVLSVPEPSSFQCGSVLFGAFLVCRTARRWRRVT